MIRSFTGLMKFLATIRNGTPRGLYHSLPSNIQRIQCINQVVEVILRPLRLVLLALGNADAESDRLPAVGDQLAVSLLSGDLHGVVAAEEFGEIDLETAGGADWGAGDGGTLVVGEHDGLFGADA